MLNLVIGALALLVAREILTSGGGFNFLMMVLAFASTLVFFAALLLPAKDGEESYLKSAPAE